MLNTVKRQLANSPVKIKDWYHPATLTAVMSPTSTELVVLWHAYDQV